MTHCLMELSRQQERPIMVTWHPVGTKSARGSMWCMHRCFRLRGMKSSSWTCVEHAGLLDSAQVSRHSRDCMQAGPPLCMQQSVDATIAPSCRAFVERCGSGRNRGHCQGVRCMLTCKLRVSTQLHQWPVSMLGVYCNGQRHHADMHGTPQDVVVPDYQTQKPLKLQRLGALVWLCLQPYRGNLVTCGDA